MSILSAYIEVFNMALVRQGENAVDASDDSMEAVLYRSVADAVIRALLSRHKFFFARKTVKLAYQGKSEDGLWHIYALPEDMLLVQAATIDGCHIPKYELMARTLLCQYENEDVYLHYIYNAPPADWSADFMEAAVMKFEEIVLRAVLEDRPQATRRGFEAEEYLLDVIVRDEYQHPVKDWVPDNNMSHVWRGRRSRR